MRGFTERIERQIISRFTWRNIFSVGFTFLGKNLKKKKIMFLVGTIITVELIYELGYDKFHLV